MMNETLYGKLYRAKAALILKTSGNAEVRAMWNPNRNWREDKFGRRLPDQISLDCRKAILDVLRRYGPLKVNQLYKLLEGFGERRIFNAKDFLVTDGQIVILDEPDRKQKRYALAPGGQQ